YWYSYAQSPEQARTEARLFIRTIGDKKFDLPIYLDIEDSSMSGLGRGTLDDIVRAFGEEIQNAGYYYGVYSNLNWYNNIISGS
ncbi:GH25 family lysozyme, partial [Ralstonia pseudosolanacearum]|uniref:GH25 family lysozyme n=1 Tax=Ralstonia pseudosolanacearum TaxID=1310165 RepID=UPI003D17AFF3